MFLKKGMKVKVCVGRDKGKTGEIIEINRQIGRASLTLTTIKSPTDAYLLLEPPRTLMHSTLLAPVLSATNNSVCTCIIFQ